MSVQENLVKIQAKVKASQSRSRSASSGVTIKGVSKLQPDHVIHEGVRAGVINLGENYVQEFNRKKSEFTNVKWHLIGPLQSNKAKSVVGEVELIHSVDRMSLVKEISKLSVERGITQKILVQVNIAAEHSKSGVTESEAPALCRSIRELQGVQLLGFMTMPPLSDTPEESRVFFRKLRELRDKIQTELGVLLPILSMGTSQDYEVAVEEGATHIRVGTILFGERE